MLGIDQFIQASSAMKKVSLGLLTNHAVFASSGYPVAYELLRQGFSIKKIFSPEHGILSQGEDGKEQSNGLDYLTQLPVISLYGKELKPERSDLDGIDVVLVDLPNVGCRFYTYWWTISFMMEACALQGKKLIIMDRPNLSGRKIDSVEGPMLDEKNCSSFLGRWNMPLTFPFSFGQLVRWYVHDRKIPLDFEVVSYSESLDVTFIPPSPAINSQQAVWAFPFMGLFEGLNVNTGRGTTFPFHVIGAPWINSLQLHQAFVAQKFRGIEAFPYSYLPMWSRYAGVACHGLYFQITDLEEFKPVMTGIWLMNYLSVNYAELLETATYPTAANPSGEKHLDLLLGVPHAHDTFCSGKEIRALDIAPLLNVREWCLQVSELVSNQKPSPK